MSPNWMSVIASQISALPYMLSFLGGIVLAIVFWNRQPMVSLLALLGFGILLGNLLLGVLLTFWLTANPGGPRINGGLHLFTFFNLLRSLTSAGAYGLLMAAIFGWRSPGK